MFIYKYSIEVGHLEDENLIYKALVKLSRKYKANKYDMIRRNCNHFANEFLFMLTGKNLPKHCNRIADVGSYIHCCVPKKYLIVTPQD